MPSHERGWHRREIVIHPEQYEDIKMNKLIEHIKKVAFDDIRLFFEPFTKVTRLIRRLATAMSSRFRRSKTKDEKEGDQ